VAVPVRDRRAPIQGKVAGSGDHWRFRALAERPSVPVGLRNSGKFSGFMCGEDSADDGPLELYCLQIAGNNSSAVLHPPSFERQFKLKL